MRFEWMSFLFFGISALLHILFFAIESFFFQKPNGYKLFNLDEKNHAAVKIWAFQQGFYNLFLGLGMICGLTLVILGRRESAGLLVSFCGLSMIGAGLVLFFSVSKMRRAACLQLIPPILGFFCLAFHIANR